MADFDEASIEIGYYVDDWGPYSFLFPIATSATANDGALPFGSTISAANVRSFLGSVTRKSLLSSETELTGLIDADYTPQIYNDNQVLVKFAYPGDNYKTQKVTLIFELTLSTGAKKEFYFQYARIK